MTKRHLALFLIIALLMGFAAPASAQPNAQVLPDAPLRVIFDWDFDGYGGGQEAFTALNNVLRELGFALTFEAFAYPRGFDNTSYREFIEQNIGGNAVFVPFLGDVYGLGRALMEEGLLGDFYDVAMDYASGYMAQIPKSWLDDESETMHFIPVWRPEPYPNIPAVLVREDIAAEFGWEIRTASDYLALLDWLKDRDPQEIPGVTVFDWYMPLNFFLPDMGYWNSNDFRVLHELTTSIAHPFFAIPEGRLAIEEFARLQRDKLLYIKDGYADEKAFDQFPTVLLYAYDFYDAGVNYVNFGWSAFGAFDASGYRMYTLYNDVLPLEDRSHFTYSGIDAFAGPDADVSEFLNLLEWLTVRDNYNLLFYGVEGEHYTLSGGRMEPLEEDGGRRLFRDSIMRYFKRSEFARPSFFAPYNYESELAAFSFAYEISFEEGHLAAAEWAGSLNEEDLDAYYSSVNAVYDLMISIFTYSGVLNENIVRMRAEETMQKMQRNAFLLEAYVDIVNEMLGGAEMR